MKSLFAAALVATSPAIAVATTVGMENEGNDSFSDRNLFGPGVHAVDGSLEPEVTAADADDVSTRTLSDGDTTPIGIPTGASDGESFIAAIDNSASGVDTVVRSQDAVGDVDDVNDDGSPFGDGLGSIVEGLVDGGSINLEVTGFPDFDFLGDHTESGEYDLLIFLNRELSDFADIDFLSFTGLTPGAEFVAEITEGDFDSLIGLFDDRGDLIDEDDDGGDGLLSRLEGTVPGSGALTFAVTGFGDFAFEGVRHGETGDYRLSLTTTPVPLPPAKALMVGALGCLASLRRRA